MSEAPDVQPAPELPEPSPALILIFALVQAHTRSLSRKERARFVLDVSEALGLQGASLNVLPFRAPPDEAMARAMREAVIFWRRGLAVLVEGDG